MWMSLFIAHFHVRIAVIKRDAFLIDSNLLVPSWQQLACQEIGAAAAVTAAEEELGQQRAAAGSEASPSR